MIDYLEFAIFQSNDTLYKRIALDKHDKVVRFRFGALMAANAANKLRVNSQPPGCLGVELPTLQTGRERSKAQKIILDLHFANIEIREAIWALC